MFPGSKTQQPSSGGKCVCFLIKMRKRKCQVWTGTICEWLRGCEGSPFWEEQQRWPRRRGDTRRIMDETALEIILGFLYTTEELGSGRLTCGRASRHPVWLQTVLPPKCHPDYVTHWLHRTALKKISDCIPLGSVALVITISSLLSNIKAEGEEIIFYKNLAQFYPSTLEWLYLCRSDRGGGFVFLLLSHKF